MIKGGIVICFVILVDYDVIWDILQLVYCVGEIYCILCDISCVDVLVDWFVVFFMVFVVEVESCVLGISYVGMNWFGLVLYVVNVSFVIYFDVWGCGIVWVLVGYVKDWVWEQGFWVMQFNFVVLINVDVVYLWQKVGFDIVGWLLGVFFYL